MAGKFILVIGGAASGKSAFAESLIIDSGLSRIYLATSRAYDDEMRDKIARHIEMRGAGWDTVEDPLEPGNTLKQAGADKAVLIDCATMWLTNHMMDESDLGAAEARLTEALRRSDALCVLVTNEVGQGIVPADALSRRFRQLQGELNQRLAAQADVVINVIAGLPQVLKSGL